MPELVSIGEIRSAAERLDGIALRTPLVPFPGIEPRLLLKPESLQPTGSFKLRGAYAAISALPPTQRAVGVITHSSGNHGLAVAYAAAMLKIQATVVVPASAPEVKVAAAAALGAQIVTCEPSMAGRLATTRELIARHGYVLIPPFDHRDVIAGQGTIGLEIAADCPQADLIICPVSGGGLISGIAAATAALNPAAMVIGAEPELAADAQDSLRRGTPVAWPASDTQRTIADSLRVEQVGELPWQHLTSQVHSIVTVTEREITRAMHLLATRARLVAEPGGAVATAACLFHAAELPPATTRVAILSGGNVDPALLARALTGEQASGAGNR